MIVVEVTLTGKIVFIDSSGRGTHLCQSSSGVGKKVHDFDLKGMCIVEGIADISCCLQKDGFGKESGDRVFAANGSCN